MTEIIAEAPPRASRTTKRPKAGADKAPAPKTGNKPVNAVVSATRDALDMATALTICLLEQSELHDHYPVARDLFVDVDTMLAAMVGADLSCSLHNVQDLLLRVGTAIAALDGGPADIERTKMVVWTLASQVEHHLQRVHEALSADPVDLAALKALDTFAGARPYRGPRPPIRRVAPENAPLHFADSDVEQVFEVLAQQSEIVRSLAWKSREDAMHSPFGTASLKDLQLIGHISAFMGSICDTMIGGRHIGNPACWATGDGIEPTGGAA